MAYHHGNLREALVDAALGQVRSQGPAALTLRGAAEGAGVSHNAPYHHFRDKEALLAAVAEAGFRQLQGRMAVADRADPNLSLLSMGQAYLQFATEEPHLYRLMFGSAIPDKGAHEALREAASATFQALVDALQALGGSTPAELRAIHVWAMVHGLASLLIDKLHDAPVSPFCLQDEQVRSSFLAQVALVARG